MPEAVLRPRGELAAQRDPEQVVEEERVVEAADELVVHLLVRAEDVRVVLDEVPNPQEPVEHAGELVPVQVPGLGEAKRQLPVAVRS